MKIGAPRSELLTVTQTFMLAGRGLVVVPDFAVPEGKWATCSTTATVRTPDSKEFDWPLALELSHFSMRRHPSGPGSVWRVIPCFRNLPQEAVPVGSRVLVEPGIAVRLLGRHDGMAQDAALLTTNAAGP